MKFVDEVEIEIGSGKGGKGAVSFRREKYAPKMGPDGGDGGRGGSVYFVATHDLQSLLDFRFSSKYFAEDGEDGQRNDCNGKAGEDLVIRVPVGTEIFNLDSGHRIADLVEPNQKVLILAGGRGGLGNMNFATPTRQAPDFAQPGESGRKLNVKLELKLLADVALVGFPNAGKSTLISRISAAKPKIANYPFTTLVPNLGVVRGKSLDFVVADIPGLIEGASDGKGLGIRFLKHIERCRALIFLLDLDPETGRSLDQEFEILLKELTAFSVELSQKPSLVVFNKADAFSTEPDKDPLFKEFLLDRGGQGVRKKIEQLGWAEPVLISAVSGWGLDQLKDKLEGVLKSLGTRNLQNYVSEETRVLGDVALFSEPDQSEGDEFENIEAVDTDDRDSGHT